MVHGSVRACNQTRNERVNYLTSRKYWAVTFYFSFGFFEYLYAWAVTMVAQRCASPPFNSTTCRQGGMANIKCRKHGLRSLRHPARENRTVPLCLPFDHTECQWNLNQLYRNHKGNRIKVNTRVRKMSSARDTGCFVGAPLGAIEGSRKDQACTTPRSVPISSYI